eukprot:7390840-Prymnesium_polylepis.1
MTKRVADGFGPCGARAPAAACGAMRQPAEGGKASVTRSAKRVSSSLQNRSSIYPSGIHGTWRHPTVHGEHT